MAEQKLKVMVSSTMDDLAEYRRQVMDACLRQGMFPMMMEHLGAQGEAAIPISLKLVDQADIYVGVYAHRYGYIPRQGNPRHLSITELEYHRAVERGIPRLIFLIDPTDGHGKSIQGKTDIIKLEKFLDMVKRDNYVNFFTTPESLRSNVINSLSSERLARASLYLSTHSEPESGESHSPLVGSVPRLPEPYIAHPYTLLQTHELVGRKAELQLLSDWAGTSRAAAFSSHVFCISAIGGAGKSALVWKWFNQTASTRMRPFSGSMWWSFYEKDSRFENFVIRALAYVSGRSLEKVTTLSTPERETELLTILNRDNFLIVLDGLERELFAYAGMDADRLPESTVVARRNQRRATDPRVGSFLRRLSQLKSSRILISSRLTPFELQIDSGAAVPGSYVHDLESMTDGDAVALLKTFGVSGTHAVLLPILKTFDKHPLLIQVLAGVIKRFRKAPGNFEEWRAANPQFDPAGFEDLLVAMSHVLDYSLPDPNTDLDLVLRYFAAYRRPEPYKRICETLIGEGKACGSELELDRSLTELEDRGLLGWDKQSNRYDMHPMVRAVVWARVGKEERHEVYTAIHAQFEAVPTSNIESVPRSLDDLTPAVEMYNSYIGLGRTADAAHFFAEQLDEATLWKFGTARLRIELLELLFNKGVREPPELSGGDLQAYVLNALANGYQLCGQQAEAADLYERSLLIYENLGDERNRDVCLCNLSEIMRSIGKLEKSISHARAVLQSCPKYNDRLREAIAQNHLGMTLAITGYEAESESAFQRSLQLIETNEEGDTDLYKTVIILNMAQRSLWFRDYSMALAHAESAARLANTHFCEPELIRATRIQGEALLGQHDLGEAKGFLDRALNKADSYDLFEQQSQTRVALAELERRKGHLSRAKEYLEGIWENTERGSYVLVLVDALNVLAHIERNDRNHIAAIAAASRAHELASCDGPPYEYFSGLASAQDLMDDLESRKESN